MKPELEYVAKALSTISEQIRNEEKKGVNGNQNLLTHLRESHRALTYWCRDYQLRQYSLL